MSKEIKPCICCERPACKRGLCRPCYSTALRLIAKGESSWDEFERLNLAFKATRKIYGRSPFVRDYLDRKTEEALKETV